MARVATVAQHLFLQNSITSTQERIYDRQIQIATGKKSLTYSGISKDTQRLLTVEVRKARTETFIEQNGLLESRMQLMDTALDGMFQIASNLKSSLIQRLSDNSGPAGNLAQEAQAMLDSVTGFLNSQNNGRYLFSGTLTATQPVTVPVPDPTTFGVPDATYYNGDSVELTARVSDSVEITYGVTGDRLGFQQLIGALKATIRGDALDDAGLMSTALGLVSQTIDNLTDYRAEVGSMMSLTSRATVRHRDFALYSEGVISDLENVEITAAIAALSSDETLLQASFLTIGRLGRLSLADFI